MSVLRKLGIGRAKDPLERLSDLPEEKLKRFVASQEFELESLDQQLDAKEQRLQATVKEGIGAPRRKKLRLAEKASARNMEIQQYMNAYVQQLMVYGISNSLLAIRSANQTLTGSQKEEFQELMGVKDVEDLRELFRELHLASEARQEPLREICETLQRYADRTATPNLGQNDFLGMMEELEAHRDPEALDEQIRVRVTERLGADGEQLAQA